MQTSEQQAEQLLLTGLPCKTVAYKVGLCKSRVDKISKRMRQTGSLPALRDWEPLKADILKMVRSGMRPNEIARQLGVKRRQRVSQKLHDWRNQGEDIPLARMGRY